MKKKARYKLVEISIHQLLEMERAGKIFAPAEMCRPVSKDFVEDYGKALLSGSYMHPLVFGREPDSDRLVLIDGSRRLQALRQWGREHDPALAGAIRILCVIEDINGLYDAYTMASRMNFHQLSMTKFDALRLAGGVEVWRQLMEVQKKLLEISGMQLRWPEQGEGVFLALQVFWAWKNPRQLAGSFNRRLESEWNMARWAMERFRIAILKKTEANVLISRYVRCLHLIRNIMGPRMFYLRDPAEYRIPRRIFLPHSTHFSMMTAAGLLDIPWNDPHPASVAAVRRKLIEEIERSGRYTDAGDSGEERNRDLLVRSRVQEMRRIFADFLCRQLGMEQHSRPMRLFCEKILFCKKCKAEIRSPLEADATFTMHLYCAAPDTTAGAE